MKRREFFRYGVQKAGDVTREVVRAKMGLRDVNCIRPPFARTEPEFAAACTRCDKCIEACPHDVIFKLTLEQGGDLAGTPALDLVWRGCHMCEDWPCVKACEPQALLIPEHEDGEEIPLPRLGIAEVDTKACLPYSGPECGACAHSCPVDGALNWEGGTRPVIDADMCTGCGLCREACIAYPNAIKISAHVYEKVLTEKP